MRTMLSRLHLLLCLLLVERVEGWTHSMAKRRGAPPSHLGMTTTTTATTSNKDAFLASLDHLDRLNEHSKDRTRLLQVMLDSKVEIPIQDYMNGDGVSNDNLSIENPGDWESMQPVSEGTWKVVYAPHMTIMVGIGGGSLDVSYILSGDEMISHAVCEFPWLPNGKVILSVSGTFGSVSSQVCRVDFDRAWVTLDRDQPFVTFENVPEDGSKSIISALGQLFFIDQVSVFPVSFLDGNLIVFDFELLGTRICARKIE